MSEVTAGGGGRWVSVGEGGVELRGGGGVDRARTVEDRRVDVAQDRYHFIDLGARVRQQARTQIFVSGYRGSQGGGWHDRCSVGSLGEEREQCEGAHLASFSLLNVS